MRNCVLLAVLVGALLGGACTNDYDAFLEQAGGADAASSSGAEATSTADTSSSSATTTTASSGSTSSASSSDASSSATSTASGEGGAGGGGTGGGAGGSSQSVPGCTGFALSLEDSIDDIESDGFWKLFVDPKGDPEVETMDDELRLVFDDGGRHIGGLRADLAERTGWKTAPSRRRSRSFRATRSWKETSPGASSR